MSNQTISTGFIQPCKLDVLQFAINNMDANSTNLLDEFPRLAQVAPQAQTNTQVQWQAHGHTKTVLENATEIWVDIQAQVKLPFTCQRCLQDIEKTISIKRSIRFVQDEAVAAVLDEKLEEDVLVHSTQFDLLALIEDELIMELPYAPKHSLCADTAQSQTSNESTHPFAKLRKLKKQ